jgi:hypothetical protein
MPRWKGGVLSPRLLLETKEILFILVFTKVFVRISDA